MKYIIDEHNFLFIYNDSGKQMFITNEHMYWYKNDYDQHGNRVYYEDNTGFIINYNR